MRLAILQMNPVIGDVQHNTRRLRTHVEKLHSQVDLFVTPEQALLGYPARDLLSQPQLLEQETRALEEIRQLTAQFSVGILVGHTTRSQRGRRPLHNSATLFDHGQVSGTVHKRHLPSYDVFEEERFFDPAPENSPRILLFREKKLGISICEDLWHSPLGFGMRDVRKYRSDLGAEDWKECALLINLSASPYAINKAPTREDLGTALSLKTQRPLLYVNAIGGQDDLVFDGQSFCLDSKGRPTYRAPAFQEGAFCVALDQDQWKVPTPSPPPVADTWQTVSAALELGLHDFVKKTGHTQVLLGLSGGIDSALCATLAVRALSKENVSAITLPSRWNSTESEQDAFEIAQRLGISCRRIPIEPVVETLTSAASIQAPLALENLQSRTRGVILSTLANQEGRLLLTTGNKSELAMGYATLYGDTNGALAPLGDLYKTEIYALSHALNHQALSAGILAPIPESVLRRPPSAELSSEQKDTDSLPEYEVLDALLLELIENQGEVRGSEEAWNRILAPRHSLNSIRSRVFAQEFKRHQYPPILKVHLRSLGSGWHMPIAKGRL